MSQSDKEYLLARALRERALAAEASNEVVQEVHLKLAREYEVRANIQTVSSGADTDVIGLTAGDSLSS
jgi:hypothetical protein